VSRLLLAYRTLANIVGVLLIVLVFVVLPLNELHNLNAAWIPAGTTAQTVGAKLAMYLGITHGWLYMGFLVTAFLLSRRAQWGIGFTLMTLFLGTVPIASFWAEHNATALVRSRHQV
jgi:integral membrane protein